MSLKLDLANGIVIYTDGACSGNPGPGGWGAIVAFGEQVQELGGADSPTTNNRMELMGLLQAMRWCLDRASKKSETKAFIFTDSVYVIKGLTQWMHGWKKRNWRNSENEEVSNKDIWIQLDQVFIKFKEQFSNQVEFYFVRGHEGIDGNERCDKIAVAYSKDDYINLYRGSREDYIFDISETPRYSPLPEFKNKSSGEAKTVWYLSYVNGVLQKHKTWKECEAVVKGRPAKFKKVSSEAEENEVKKGWGIN